MKLRQLSLFLENQPGHLLAATRLLAHSDVNLETMTLADTEQFGILRMIVNDWQRAKEVLQSEGFIVKVTEVVAVVMEDRPGGLVEVLEIFEGKDLNVEYMYAFTYRQENRPVMVFRFDSPDAAVELLQEKGFRVVGDESLFGAKDQ
jgi:hypothetical protein